MKKIIGFGLAIVLVLSGTYVAFAKGATINIDANSNILEAETDDVLEEGLTIYQGSYNTYEEYESIQRRFEDEIYKDHGGSAGYRQFVDSIENTINKDDFETKEKYEDAWAKSYFGTLYREYGGIDMMEAIDYYLADTNGDKYAYEGGWNEDCIKNERIEGACRFFNEIIG